MTANPLIAHPGAARPGRVTVDMLRRHAEDLNRQGFVIASGKPYYVSIRRREDGSTYHALDRQI